MEVLLKFLKNSALNCKILIREVEKKSIEFEMESIDGSFFLTLLVRISTIVDESGVLTEFYKNADQNFVENSSKKQMNSA